MTNNRDLQLLLMKLVELIDVLTLFYIRIRALHAHTRTRIVRRLENIYQFRLVFQYRGYRVCYQKVPT